MSGSAAGDREAEGETVNPSSFSAGSTLTPHPNAHEETQVFLSTHILDAKSYFFFRLLLSIAFPCLITLTWYYYLLLT